MTIPQMPTAVAFGYPTRALVFEQRALLPLAIRDRRRFANGGRRPSGSDYKWPTRGSFLKQTQSVKLEWKPGTAIPPSFPRQASDGAQGFRVPPSADCYPPGWKWIMFVDA
ncbi:hypothetical protein, partial [Bradyrhizobium sp. ARR65]|uniref:hypothetical protein n=1 Tax=Bradyrhizobium sp. ARR65 TaxID=1040989 RepID=UPI001AECFBAA